MRLPRVAPRAIAMVALAFGAACAAAATADAGATVIVRPAWPVYLPGYAGSCLPYGACAWVAWGDRRPRLRPVAPEPPEAVDQDIWGSTGSPWGYLRRLPPPTPQSHIQPRYQEASTIRPEFGGP